MGSIMRVAGPLVVATGLENAKMYDVVRVGRERLLGEIIELRGDKVSIQVYEETGGLGPDDPVEQSGFPLSVELGPGLLGSIYDGVQRPLEALKAASGDFISRGIQAPGLDRSKRWKFEPVVEVGQTVESGDIIGTVQETGLIEHRLMVPPGMGGRIAAVHAGERTVEEVVADIEGPNGGSVTMVQTWPVRRGRPTTDKLSPEKLLVTGQRVVDSFFPLAKGGTATVPGPFGSGKTVLQHALAKWADAEIIIFIGCGERGNEMTDVLQEFPELVDPYSGRPLMERTVLIANTSNMPVAAREASIYTGITIAEYFRDMGYNVALQADSTSRWAEALREISGRLEEMPGEEGYPAYLSSRLAAFYERAGSVVCQGQPERRGSVTVIGSVSPPGGDLSEPVVQATLRVVKVFWGLEDKLAYERHFPAINWLISYSLYMDRMEAWWANEVDPDFPQMRESAMALLQVEAELREIVRLVGVESLSMGERLSLDTARMIREDFLQQNAFDERDSFTSPLRQFLMLKLIITWHDLAVQAAHDGVGLEKLLSLPVRSRIAATKYLNDEELGVFNEIEEELLSTVPATVEQG
jgi:V/A-type H+-transporting ATPase subunit A